MEEKFITAFEAARETYALPSSINITYHESSLAAVDQSVKFDAIVSPANSFARMDGGFDDALSRAFAPRADYLALTRVTQAAVYKEYRGFAPPGSCLLIDLDEESLKKNDWGCRYLALCPTMKTPSDVRWDREVVFECIWTLLAAIERHNRRVAEAKPDTSHDGSKEKEIRSVMMTPLATGCGIVSAEKWAAQTVIAMRQFVEAEERAGLEKRWEEILRGALQVKKTWNL